MILLLLIICLSCLTVAGVLMVTHRSHHPDYALTARLEHELLSGPFDHKACNQCLPERSFAALARVSPLERNMRVTAGIGGDFTPAVYHALRPQLMRPEYNAVARPDATIKTLGGEDFRGTNSD